MSFDSQCLAMPHISAATLHSQQIIRTTALSAVLAIALGVFMQAAIISVKLLGGANIPGVAMAAGLVQSVTWSTVICVGVSIATSVSKGRKALAGLLGACFAPLGVATAKAMHKGTLELLSAVDQPAVLPLLMVGTVRALEYGLLAWILTSFAERDMRRPLPYLATGLSIGIVGGSVQTFLACQTHLANGVPLAMPQIAGTLVSEVGSPLGCAFVILVSQILPQHTKAYAVSRPVGGAAPN